MIGQNHAEYNVSYLEHHDLRPSSLAREHCTMTAPIPSEAPGNPSFRTAGDASKTPSRRKLSMALVNFWLDAALFLAILFLVWVSVMLQVVFPAPTSAAGWQLWGLSFDQWRDAQFYSLCGCALLALEHLVLHWNWVCAVLATQILRLKARPDEGSQAVYGVATFILILLAMMAGIIAAILSVQSPSDPAPYAVWRL